MDFRSWLSERIGMNDIAEIVSITHDSEEHRQELYELVLQDDVGVGYYAAWVLSHFSREDNEWLFAKQNELIDEVLVCKHAGKRRVILHLLFKQPMPDTPRVDFLDFCLERMVSKQELPGVRSLCMKLAYELCRSVPELMQELKALLEIMEPESLMSITTVRRNILKAMKKGKSLQK